MHSRTRAAVGTRKGHPSFKLAARLGSAITAGRYPMGTYLPGERELAAGFRVASMTARRALKILERDGLVAAEPRKGYRVLARSADPDKGAPLAYVLPRPSEWQGARDGRISPVMHEMQQAAGRRGWSLLVVEPGGLTSGEVMEQLRVARVCGVVLGAIDAELLARIREAGIAVIADDAWPEDADADAVMQDGFRGGMLAASWLTGRGHRRVAFLGPQVAGARPQIVERYSGALGALARAGLPWPETAWVSSEAEAEARAFEMLGRPDRPTGVLALWRDIAVGAVRAARRLGLVLGKDLDLVGWCTEENYEAGFRSVLAGGEVPPAVVWSVRELAETAVARLEQRRRNQGLPTIHLRIPVKLMFAKGDES